MPRPPDAISSASYFRAQAKKQRASAPPPPKYAQGRQAAGGAVLRRQTFQPENRKQQAELHANATAERDRLDRLAYAHAAHQHALTLYRQGKRKEAIALNEHARMVAGLSPEPSPGRVGGLIENLGADVISSATGLPTGVYGLRHPVRQAKQIGRSYAHTYGPLVHGDVGEFGRRAYKHPLGPLLDAFSVASLGTTAAAKAGLLRVPAERSLAFEGGQVQPLGSPNTLTRLLEHKADRLSEQHPTVPAVGSRARVARRIPFEAEREHERSLAAAIPFQQARRKLSKAEDFAYDRILRYGDKAPERVDQEIAFRTKRLAKATTLVEKRGQKKTLLQLGAARQHVLEPSPRLQETVRLGRELAAKTQQTKIDVGQLTPEAAAERIHLPSRLVSGAKLERTPARQGRVEQIREYPGKTVDVVRPRTRAEAEQRLAAIDAANEKVMRAIMEREAPTTKGARTLQAGRNMQAKKGFRRPTVSQQLEEHAQKILSGFLDQHPNHPVARAYLKREAEANQVRELLNAPEDPFTAPSAEPDFGSVQETVQRPGRRVHLPAVEPQRASSRIVGAEDARAGEGAAFVPDVSRMQIRSLGQRARTVTGKPRKLVYRNEGVLFTQGRTRAGSRLTLEDFQKASRYRSHLLDIEHAAKFTKPLHLEIPGGLEPGHRYFNPRGVTLPRSFRDAPAAADIEGLTPKEIAHLASSDYEALVRNTFPDEAGVRNLPPEVAQHVRQVDEKIARAFESGGARFAGHGGTLGHVLASTLDATNNLTRAAALYLKGSFVPANFAGNSAFGVIQQGPWYFKNLASASARLGRFSPETLRLMDLELGSGAARAIGGEGKGFLGTATHKLADVSGYLADTGPRRTAFMHEAAKAGFKTDAQVRRLLTDARLRRKLNQIGETSENAMVKFRGLSADERRIISRAIFVYPWIKGATRYLGRLPFDRPLRADFLAHLGEQGSADTLHQLGHLASYLEGVVPLGRAEKRAGVPVVPVVNPSSVTPLGTGAQVLQAAEGALSGGSVPTSERLAQFASPAVKAAIEAGTGYNTFLGENYPASVGARDIVFQNLVSGFPAYKLASGLVSPPKAGPPGTHTYVPEGGGRLGVLERFGLGSLRRRELNVAEAQKRGQEEQLATLPPPERFKAKMGTLRKTLLDDGRRVGILQSEQNLPPELDQALQLHARRYGAYKRKNATSQLDRYKIDLRLLATMGKIAPPDRQAALRWAASAPKTAIESERRKIAQSYFNSEWLSYAVKQLGAHGVDVTVPR